MKKKEMTVEDLTAFFDDVAGFVFATKGAPGNIWEAMEKYGIAEELPKPLAENLMPMLKASMQEFKKKTIPHNCHWCGSCGLCDGWLPINGARSAHLLGILD